MHGMEPTCRAKDASLATTDFLYLRFIIGDITIDEKDFGKILKKDRVMEMKKWAGKVKRCLSFKPYLILISLCNRIIIERNVDSQLYDIRSCGSMLILGALV
jgi:hypothetical protein